LMYIFDYKFNFERTDNLVKMTLEEKFYPLNYPR